MVITTEKNGKVMILHYSGRLDASNAQEMKEKFRSYLTDAHFFVFDLTELDFIDSTGLGAIISCMKAVNELSGEIYLANLQAKPRLLFEITRAYKIFDVFDDVDTAVQELTKIAR